MSQNRRTFLKTVGVAGIGSAALASTGTANDDLELVEINDASAVASTSPIGADDGFADISWLEDGPLVVVRVTNLDATGEGSFKWACEVGYDELDAEEIGRRIIVFEVGGVIDLQDTDIQAERENIYVAGQTAPEPGITLIRADKPGVEFDEANHFVQHIRSLPGDEISEPADPIVAGDNAYNVCFDHCTVAWGTEESMSVNAGDVSEDFTFSNNLITEPLFDSPVASGDDTRAYGTLLGNDADRLALLGNLYTHTWSRNPRLKGGTQAMVANNVWYNFERGSRIGGDVDSPNYVNYVRNQYVAGEAADFDRPIIYTNDGDSPTKNIYFEGNHLDDGYDMLADSNPFAVWDDPIDEYWPDGLDPIADPHQLVLDHAGARPAERTEIEARAIEDLLNGTGSLIDSQEEVGGYPEFEATERSLDIPEGDISGWLQSYTEAVELGEDDEDPAPPEDIDADSIVWNADGTWYAGTEESTTYAGSDPLDAMQAAVDSLSSGRTANETVVVADPATVGPHEWDGDVAAVDLPSYTTFDVREPITVEDTDEDLVIPVRAQSAESISIPELTVHGNPRYGVWLQSCTDVSLGDIHMSLGATEDVGIGIRIDDSDGSRSSEIQLDYAWIEESASHGVETYGVDDIEIGTVETIDTGGSGLQLNDTSNATVERVDAIRPDLDGGYAGLRVANSAGPEIHVEEVVVRGGARGIFMVTGSHGVTVEDVLIEHMQTHAILIQDCQDIEINGGVIRENFGEAVRIDSRYDDDHPPSSNVTVRDLRVVDERDEQQQTYGIRETGPDTNGNAILDNDLRNAGREADLEVYAPDTVVEGNRLTGEEPPGDEPEPIDVGEYEVEDSTGDGLYNDFTGDGETGFDDVSAFADNLDAEGVQNNPEAFDFAENDRVGFADVLELLRTV